MEFQKSEQSLNYLKISNEFLIDPRFDGLNPLGIVYKWPQLKG